MGGINGEASNYSGSHGPAAFIEQHDPWWRNRRLLALNMWIFLLLITSSTTGYDSSMMNGLQTLTNWQVAFNHPTGGMLGVLNAIQNIGCLCAYPLAPYVSDGFGRRPAMFLGAILMIIATALQTASGSVALFLGARFMLGFGLSFSSSAAPLLISEVAFPSQRAPLTSMYNTMWYFGSIIAAWTTYGTSRIPSSWSWRIPSVMQGLPSLIQIFLIYFVPESPRWLMGQGREAEARRILAYYHANGEVDDALVAYEFDEIKAAIAFDKTNNVGWLALFKTPGNRRRMRIIVALAFFSQWSGNGLVSYYINEVLSAIGITNTDTELLINGILNIYNFFVAITAGLLCDRVGRRVLFITSTIGMLVFWSLQTTFLALYSQHGGKPFANGVVAMIFLFYGFYDIAFTPLIVSYTVEILPFGLRAKGFTIFNSAVSLSLIFNQYVNPVALEALGWKYYLLYVCWLAFEAIFVYAFIVETKNKTLEETAALFDGKETEREPQRYSEDSWQDCGESMYDGSCKGYIGSDIEMRWKGSSLPSCSSSPQSPHFPAPSVNSCAARRPPL